MSEHLYRADFNLSCELLSMKATALCPAPSTCITAHRLSKQDSPRPVGEKPSKLAFNSSPQQFWQKLLQSQILLWGISKCNHFKQTGSLHQREFFFLFFQYWMLFKENQVLLRPQCNDVLWAYFYCVGTSQAAAQAKTPSMWPAAQTVGDLKHHMVNLCSTGQT